MQQTSETYRALLARGAPKQVRCNIYTSTGGDGHTYDQPNIVSATSRSSMLGDGTFIGNCIAKELHLVLRNVPDPIPRMAKIFMEFRLYESNSAYSEWLPKGTYFVDTRDEGNGIIRLNCYDPMLKCDVSFTQPGDQGNWPMLDTDIVSEIAERIGVTLDARTPPIMNKRYEIGYPNYGESAYTMREILSHIGAAYGGNWVITDENKLRLIVLGDIPADSSNYLITQDGEYITIGGYRILVSR